jgi:voltage-gated potassium channel
MPQEPPRSRDPLAGWVTPRQIALAIALIAALVVLGTGGFMLTGESFLDSLYRTMNTVTTAGMDSRPDSGAGKVLTAVLLVSGVAAFLYLIGLLLEFVVGGLASGLWERRRMNARIGALDAHHVVCGYGRVGTRVVQDLAAAGARVLVIDRNLDALTRAREDGVPCMGGDAADDAVLHEAGIERAASLVACADDDAANTYVVLTAKGVRPDLHVIARASSESAVRKLQRAGADEVVSPYLTAGDQIAALLTGRETG